MRDAAEASSEDVFARKRVADMLLRLGRTREAVDEYQVVAAAWARQGMLRQAIAVCRIILQLDMGDASTRWLFRELHARSGLPVPALFPDASGYPSERRSEVRSIPAPAYAVDGALQGSPFFAELPCTLRMAVENAVTPVSLRSGETVLTRGAPAEALFVIRRGAERLARTARLLTERRHGRATGALAASDKPPRESTPCP
ncbi:hypothetical protein LY474_22265 [Myxococcus stipitatus]|uniref:hypothetical protein n=1 Tax=Myxococcus stipitatus TaxID=83455 RepID=UPI001F3F1B1E|nr:hypothetical protein [Myxococcus stipitatus]MCE9670533.1 hypothetical protein [Myxococcus stipitatus]